MVKSLQNKDLNQVYKRIKDCKLTYYVLQLTSKIGLSFYLWFIINHKNVCDNGIKSRQIVCVGYKTN